MAPISNRTSQEFTMSAANKHHHPNTDVPPELDPGQLPVEPDEGPVPTHIPADPEHERVVDPEA
jgi:hypothetical protein